VATGEVWLAQAPITADRYDAGNVLFCYRHPSLAGRVTRGTVNNLFSPLSCKADGAEHPDLALFLDTMAGYCRSIR